MKTGPCILIVHNAYQNEGGEDTAVENELTLLKNLGIRTILFKRQNLDFSLKEKISIVASLKNNELLSNNIRKIIVDNDVTHLSVHNFWPLIGITPHRIATSLGVKVYQTIHNYRLLCANAQFMRNDKICHDCAKNRLSAIKNRCYRNSAIQSAAVTYMQHLYRDKKMLESNCDKLILLNDFAKRIFTENGFSEEKIYVKSNFVPTKPAQTSTSRRHYLFAGRISKEKGAHLIVEAARSFPSLTFIFAGDGPEKENLNKASPKNCHFIGKIDREKLGALYEQAYALIVPSLWYEGQPLTVLESFERSTPAIVSDIGGLSELVEDEKTGMKIQTNNVNSLIKAIASIEELKERGKLKDLQQACREVSIKKYSEEVQVAHYEKLYRST